MASNKKEIKEINASSMADIAFLLLIFFLVATTMNVDTGLSRVLPAIPPEDQKVEDLDVNERNLLAVKVNTFDAILVAGQQTHITQLKDKVKEFVLNPTNDENLPTRKDTEIEMPDGSTWIYPVSEGIVSLTNDRGTSYDMYIQVQNELTRAFNEIREDVAHQKFRMDFMSLAEGERDAVAKAVPLKISEAEPVNVGGN
ncbi:MAG: biopolymer transporter ExbD [Alistipes sp.]|jgi:biopolymer transport protein ExbD|nr:biopolymer transporter ExbD [Alistipes sp.]